MRTTSLFAAALCSALLITGCDPAQQQTEQVGSAIEPYENGNGFIRLKAANGFYVRATQEGRLVADSVAPETFAMHLIHKTDTKTAMVALETNDGLFLRTPGGGGLDLFVAQHTPGGGGLDLFTAQAQKPGGGGIDLVTSGAVMNGGGGVDLATDAGEFAPEEIFTLREIKPGLFTLQESVTGGVVGVQGGGGLDLLIVGDTSYSATDLFQVSFAAEPCCNQ